MAESHREALCIGNAGLVLLGPYLPRLFESLGLVRNGAFDDAAAAARAVLLTQYLVTGQIQSAMPMLVLNKLLCGLAIDAPMTFEIDVTDAERGIVDGLLQAVIAHWAALSNTSSVGLQETFLQREGRLEHADGAWQLQVQPRAFDMLLDRLPWGFATLRYDWMPEVLRVNWR